MVSVREFQQQRQRTLQQRARQQAQIESARQTQEQLRRERSRRSTQQELRSATDRNLRLQQIKEQKRLSREISSQQKTISSAEKNLQTTQAKADAIAAIELRLKGKKSDKLRGDAKKEFNKFYFDDSTELAEAIGAARNAKLAAREAKKAGGIPLTAEQFSSMQRKFERERLALELKREKELPAIIKPPVTQRTVIDSPVRESKGDGSTGTVLLTGKEAVSFFIPASSPEAVVAVDAQKTLIGNQIKSLTSGQVSARKDEARQRAAEDIPLIELGKRDLSFAIREGVRRGSEKFVTFTSKLGAKTGILPREATPEELRKQSIVFRDFALFSAVAPFTQTTTNLIKTTSAQAGIREPLKFTGEEVLKKGDTTVTKLRFEQTQGAITQKGTATAFTKGTGKTATTKVIGNIQRPTGLLKTPTGLQFGVVEKTGSVPTTFQLKNMVTGELVSKKGGLFFSSGEFRSFVDPTKQGGVGVKFPSGKLFKTGTPPVNVEKFGSVGGFLDEPTKTFAAGTRFSPQTGFNEFQGDVYKLGFAPLKDVFVISGKGTASPFGVPSLSSSQTGGLVTLATTKVLPSTPQQLTQGAFSTVVPPITKPATQVALITTPALPRPQFQEVSLQFPTITTQAPQQDVTPVIRSTTKTKQFVKLESAQSIQQKEAQKQSAVLKQSLGLQQSTAQKQSLIQQQTLAQKQSVALQTFFNLARLNVPKIPPIPPLISSASFVKRRKLSPTFQVGIITRGRKQIIGRGLTKTQAKKLGIKRVLAGTEATFYLKKGRGLTFEAPSVKKPTLKFEKLFRKPKKGSKLKGIGDEVFIQKKTKTGTFGGRLAFRGEKIAIKAARRRSIL